MQILGFGDGYAVAEKLFLIYPQSSEDKKNKNMKKGKKKIQKEPKPAAVELCCSSHEVHTPEPNWNIHL